ncbi:MAG: LytR C-terminal domain-containing protein, partial [Acidimicrobiales bacterium]
PYLLPDDLVSVDDAGVRSVVVPAGSSDLDATTLASVYGWRNPGESTALRFERQHVAWETWLSRIAIEGPEESTPPLANGLPEFMRALGGGTSDVELAPLVPVAFDPDNPVFTLPLDAETWPADKGLDMVPVPISSHPGARPTVRLLDGTGDADNRLAMIKPLVAAGAEISAIGNADTFDVTETTVTYHLASGEAAAQALADAIGATLRFDDDDTVPFDITVTVGSDVTAR